MHVAYLAPLLLLLVCVEGRATGGLSVEKQGAKRDRLLDARRRGRRSDVVRQSLVTQPIMLAALKQKGEDGLQSLLVKHGGAAAIFGGMISHLIFGTLYCWGNFASYAPPSLRFFDGQEHKGSPDATLVFPLTLVSQCFAMPFGTMLAKQLGPRATMLLGCSLVSAGVYMASFAKTLSTFIFFYSIVFGTGVGLGYTAAMIAGWKWMPHAKGLVSGLILTGFGAGGFIFNLVGTYLANPNGANPVNGKFPPEVYANFPKMLRTLSIVYICMAALGSIFITDPSAVGSIGSAPPSPDVENSKKQTDKKELAAPDGLALEEALKTPQFYLMWCMIVMSASAGLNVASVYKQFASVSPALAGDSFQSLVGGLGALSNGGGRIFWGTLSDKIGFKQSFAILTLVQALVHAYYPSTSQSKIAFTFFTCLCYFLLAGNFALMPPSIQRIYGPKNGALIYGIIYSAFGFASIGSLFMNKHLSASLGLDGVFRVLSVFSIIAAVLTSQLVPVSKWAGSQV
jgi:OFA family oxalate/formate antiporter-like MFS transporter